MKQNIIILISLLIVETFTSILISLLYFGIFENNLSSSQIIFNSINTPLLIGLWRLMFYLIPSTLISFLFFYFLNEKNNVFYVVFFNVLLFSLLNVFYKSINFFPFLNFNEILFWLTIIPILFSPIILNFLPYFKKKFQSH